MRRREFLQRATATGVVAAAVPNVRTLFADQGERKADRPNIVYIMADQQHWQAMGCVDSYYDTPNLDALAEDAALFERAFCTTPQCSPSRSSMMTGLYPSKTGVMGNVGAAGGGSLQMPTIGAMLQDAGYLTGYFGKWHLGGDPTGNAGWHVRETRSRDPKTAELSAAFVQEHKEAESPFFLVTSYLDPHDIYHFKPEQDQATDPRTKLSPSWEGETFEGKPPVHLEFMTRDQGTLIHGRPREVWEAYREFYREKVRLFDQYVGQVLQAIRDAGRWDDTIILIGSDHGDMDTHHRLIFKGPFMYEHMVRVPFLARVPERFGGKMNGRRIADYDTVNTDLVPTIREFAGLDAIETDGLSLRPLLTGSANAPRRDYVIGQYYSKQQWVNPIRMLRTADWKYNAYIDHGDELYDLKNDPHELVNLAGDAGYAKIEKELAGELEKWIDANNDPFRSFETTPLKKGFDHRAKA